MKLFRICLICNQTNKLYIEINALCFVFTPFLYSYTFYRTKIPIFLHRVSLKSVYHQYLHSHIPTVPKHQSNQTNASPFLLKLVDQCNSSKTANARGKCSYLFAESARARLAFVYFRMSKNAFYACVYQTIL